MLCENFSLTVLAKRIVLVSLAKMTALMLCGGRNTLRIVLVFYICALLKGKRQCYKNEKIGFYKHYLS